MTIEEVESEASPSPPAALFALQEALYDLPLLPRPREGANLPLPLPLGAKRPLPRKEPRPPLPANLPPPLPPLTGDECVGGGMDSIKSGLSFCALSDCN